MYWPRNSDTENNVFLLGKNIKPGHDKSSSTVFVSRNYGKNFTSLNFTLIDHIYSGKADPNLVRQDYNSFYFDILCFVLAMIVSLYNLLWLYHVYARKQRQHHICKLLIINGAKAHFALFHFACSSVLGDVFPFVTIKYPSV